MKKNNFWKRFWTLNVHNHEGFTLVELIIVIAILAILSSVAVVGYSAYIEKANKQADKTMVTEIVNALTLYYYSAADGTTGGYILLSVNGDATFAGDSVNAAMTAAYGSDWQKKLSLKYNGWKDDGLLSGAVSLSPEQIAAIMNSPFLKNNSVSDLINDVQGLSTMATDFLVSKESDPANVYNKLGQYLGEDFYDFCEENGITSENGQFTNASSTQLSNLMALYVADGMGNMTEDDYTTVLIASKYGKDAAEEEGMVLSNGINMTTYYAAQYALFTTIASSTGEDGQERLAAVDAALADAEDMGEVEAALAKFFTTSDAVADTAFWEKVNTEYGTNGFAEDTKAITATMDVASAASKGFYGDASDLNDPNFFSSDAVSSGISSYINAVAAIGSLDISLPTIAEGQVLLVIGANSPVVVASSSEVYSAN